MVDRVILTEEYARWRAKRHARLSVERCWLWYYCACAEKSYFWLSTQEAVDVNRVLLINVVISRGLLEGRTKHIKLRNHSFMYTSSTVAVGGRSKNSCSILLLIFPETK